MMSLSWSKSKELQRLLYVFLFFKFYTSFCVLTLSGYSPFIPPAPKPAHQRRSFCGGPMTLCVTRWSVRCMMPSAWSRGSLSPSVLFQVEVRWRLLCQSTWRIMPPAWWGAGQHADAGNYEWKIQNWSFFLFFIPILFLGFPRAAGYCRVCAFPSRHSQDAGCERSSGLHWPGGQAPSLPQRSSG